MKLSEYAKHLLLAPNLEDKLLAPAKHWEEELDDKPLRLQKPGRSPLLQFSDKKVKIPRLEHLNLESNKGLTLHHFANHELMAIELFAWAILAFPNAPKSIRNGWVKTIEEEQSHLKLYIDRMNDFGVQFGDIPLNYIFWKQMEQFHTLESFSAVMSLSFEGANLDYSQVYAKVFSYFGDLKTSEIMLTIFEDEVKHVKRGVRAFEKSIPPEKNSWEHYLTLIQFPFTPRRAKGYLFFPETRYLAGLDQDFVNHLSQYEDEYTGRVNLESVKKFGLGSELMRKNRLDSHTNQL
ncbi:ferritin-like domain-containing protein [Leptospira limi]|uniref:Ferritin-like domain-containing protein n=1 Tax=Leptospira limi TaxID=2950023 RepID=A0ABT3LV09_9LEPT|nr:ferritin-like domain-containing protein [Leptospira limi]MCW7461554.1 ferritin-like domain-containing protein [Leptospira limi]